MPGPDRASCLLGSAQTCRSGLPSHNLPQRPPLAPDGACIIAIASKRIPGLEGAVDEYWTDSTGGSAYGILKHGREDYLSPVTPIPWLYLTGQNIGLHGILGTTISAFNTCKSIDP